MPTDNREVYGTIEYESWAKREGLIRSEALLFERFLDSAQDTVEAGTSGGRILLELRHRGFQQLWGFDYVAEFIEQARQRDTSGEIHFSVMDATQLSYPSGGFGQAIYLQQIVSFVETAEGRRRAVAEAYRILRPGGTALFSFLCLESRQSVLPYRVFMAWVSLLRALRRRRRTIQSLPWLKLGGTFNWPSVIDAGPYVYWFAVTEAEELLREAGFRVVAVGTDEQIRRESMQVSAAALRGLPMRGHLYFVCKK